MNYERTDIENLIVNYPLIELQMIANKEKKPYGSLVDYSIETIKLAIEHYYDSEYSELQNLIMSEACRGEYNVTLLLGSFSSFHSIEDIKYAIQRGLFKERLVVFDINVTNKPESDIEREQKRSDNN